MRKKFGLGEMLVNERIITPEQLKEAKDLQIERNIRLGEALIELNLADETILLKMLSKQLRVPIRRASEIEVDPNAVEVVSEEMAKEHFAFPFGFGDGTLKFLSTDALNLNLDDQIFHQTGLRCEFYLGYEKEIETLIFDHYEREQVVNDINDMDLNELDDDFFDVGVNDENSPIVRIVNSIFKTAANEGASDIHIAPHEKSVVVRNRLDGILHEVRELPKKVHPSLVTRIKTMADMDISNKRIPQDGRIQITLDGQSIDMRVSTLPSVYGEKITIRLLDKSKVIMDIEHIGFQPDVQEKFVGLMHRSVGVVLMTGPTGSGKTTTLYTAINELNDVEKNIITIEDPVEYKMDGIVQVQVNEKAGLTFASGLRSILRQDPDIILVGEIRDKDTANTAAKASSTGHLVFATLHTNDAVSTITRLIDMGVEDYMVASTVAGIVNQRLVRKICSKCKVSYTDVGASPERTFFGIDPDEELTLHKGEGCEHCKGTGFKGRVAVQELLLIDDEMKRIIIESADERKILKRALENGFKTMKEDGLKKALDGLTTLEEVNRHISD